VTRVHDAPPSLHVREVTFRFYLRRPRD
jgi:hypothetical protein